MKKVEIQMFQFLFGGYFESDYKLNQI